MSRTTVLRTIVAAALVASPSIAQLANPDARLVPSPPLVYASPEAVVDIDGDRAVLGSARGEFRVFERDPLGDWAQAGTFTLGFAANDDGWVWGVSLSGDRVLVGRYSSTPSTPVGACLVFERDVAGMWNLVSTILSPLASPSPYFGSDVDLEGDRALVGDWGARVGANETGAAFIYERSASGSWENMAVLAVAGAQSLDYVGESVALSGDRAVIGASGVDVGPGLSGLEHGAAYVFDRQSNGMWAEVAQLEGSGSIARSLFGGSVGLSGDRAIVGAEGVQTAVTPGRAYVFERGTSGAWIEVALFSEPVNEPVYFGDAVAIHGDRAVVTSPFSGVAYLFERRTTGQWAATVQLRQANPSAPFGLGWWDVAIDGTGAIVPLYEGPSLSTACLFELGTLYHGAPEVDVSTGGVQSLHLRARDEYADHLVVMLGTASGTTPGYFDPISEATFPINPDAYSYYVVENGGGPVGPFFQYLDGDGRAQATFTVPALTSPSLAGLALHHCYLVFDPVTFSVVSVSNAAKVRLIP